MTLGPRILLLGLVAVLLVPLMLAHPDEVGLAERESWVLLVPLMLAHSRGYHRLTRWMALGTTAVVTIAVAAGVLFLVSLVPGPGTPAPSLLRDAALLWIANVVTFAVWYWEIDGGGPAQRHREVHCSEDFLFPQRYARKARPSRVGPPALWITYSSPLTRARLSVPRTQRF